MWDWKTYILFMTALGISYPFLRKYDRQDEYRGEIWLVLGLIPTFCLLAFRGITVGKDLLGYTKHVITAQYTGDNIRLSALSEPLFDIIYVISASFGGMHAFIIITSLIEYLFIFIFLKRMHNKGLEVYFQFFVLYGYVVIRSFSMISNGLAIFCSLCAFTYLGDNKKSRRLFWVYFIIAIGFHNSSIIDLVIFACCRYELFENKKARNHAIAMRTSIFLSFFIILFLLSRGTFNSIIATIGKGSYYRMQTNTNFGIGNTLVRLPFLLLILINRNNIKNRFGNDAISYMLLLVLDLGIVQMKYMAQDFERFTMFSGIAIVPLSYYLYVLLRERVLHIEPIAIIGLGTYITYNIYHWAILANYGIMPYVFWTTGM